MPDGRFETTGIAYAAARESRKLCLRGQGTWMGARRSKRGRAAGSAAMASGFRGKAGANAMAASGLVSHRQQARMNANSTLFSL